MANLDVRLLGGFEARFDSGQKIALSTRKAEALLAYLALAPGRARSRDQLAGLLWSDRAEAQAKSSLRQALTALRRGLQENGSLVLATEGESVKLAEIRDKWVSACKEADDDKSGDIDGKEGMRIWKNMLHEVRMRTNRQVEKLITWNKRENETDESHVIAGVLKAPIQ